MVDSRQIEGSLFTAYSATISTLPIVRVPRSSTMVEAWMKLQRITVATCALMVLQVSCGSLSDIDHVILFMQGKLPNSRSVTFVS